MKNFYFIIFIILNFLCVGEEPHLYPISNRDGSGYINSKGEVVIWEDKNLYNTTLPFSENLAAVGFSRKYKGKYGFINKKNEIVINPQFDDVRNFSDGRARIKIGNKWGFIDTSGNLIVKPQYSKASDFSEGNAHVTIGSEEKQETAIIDLSGNYIITPGKFSILTNFSNGLALVSKSTSDYFRFKGGYINTTGELEIDYIYRFPNGFSENLAAVGIAGVANIYINSNNEILFENLIVDRAESFFDGMAAVQLKYLWGFINKKGKNVTGFKYKDYQPFSEGLAAVTIKGDRSSDWGFIDKTGKLVIPHQFNQVNSFRNGLAKVTIADKALRSGQYLVYINKKGEIVWDFRTSTEEILKKKTEYDAKNDDKKKRNS